MFAVEVAGEIKSRRYPTREPTLQAAKRAARNAADGKAAVVWLKDDGTPKLWLAHVRMVAGSTPDIRRTYVEYIHWD